MEDTNKTKAPAMNNPVADGEFEVNRIMVGRTESQYYDKVQDVAHAP